MPDKIQSSRIICEGGLDSTQNYLNLSMNKPGSATRLVNYEVGLNGGYRRLNGYMPYDESFPEVGVGVAEGKVLGLIQFFNTVTGIWELIAARKLLSPSTEYKFYKYESGTGWVEIVTGLTHNFIAGGSTVDKLRWDDGNDGNTNYLCVVDGVNNAVLYDGSTWQFIDSGDTGADYAHAGGPMALDAPTLCSFFGHSLHLSYDLKNNTTGAVAYSAPDKFYNYTAADGGGQAVVGFPIVTMKPFRDSLYVFGYNAIKYMITDVTSGFLVKEVTKNIGCLSRDGVIEVGGDLIFIAPDGFRPIAGTDKIGDVQLETISKAIQQLVKQRITGNVGFDVNVVAIRGKSQFRMLFGGDNFSADDSRGIIGCLRTADQQNGWEFGELLGFRASCMTSHYVNGTEVTLHGDYDGCVYRQEVGSSLNGSDMVSAYSTPYLDFGDTEVRKVLEKVNIFVNGEGNLGINLGLTFDWGRAEVLNPAGYIINIEGDTPIYDDPAYMYGDPGSAYGGILTPVAFTDVQGSFFSVRLSFTTSGTEAPHSIFGFITEYHVEGRR